VTIEQVKKAFPDCAVSEVGEDLVFECKAYRFALNLRNKTWMFYPQSMKNVLRASEIIRRLVNLDKEISRCRGRLIYHGHSTGLVA
jgi:hypothetical protein